MKITKKILAETIQNLEVINNQLQMQVITLLQEQAPLRQRLSSIERILRGGEFEKEGLLFRVTLLEALIQPHQHIKQISKKQMAEIRKQLKENRIGE